MSEELKVYLYQTDDKLLSIFKQGAKGEDHFIEFMALVREELVPEGMISMTSEEIDKIQKNIRDKFGE